MKPLFDINELNNFKANEKLPLECENCNNVFYSIRKEVRKSLNNHRSVKLKYCSRKCTDEKKYKRIECICKNCNKSIIKNPSDLLSVNIFCSQSCAATYNNKNKKYGIRRSKMEIFIEDMLKKDFPDLEFLFNSKKIINSEIDIYIKNFNLGIEINGILHYKPIYGEDKFNSQKKNDENKIKICNENNIELHIIDISHINKFSIIKGLEIYEIIKTKIMKHTQA